MALALCLTGSGVASAQPSVPEPAKDVPVAPPPAEKPEAAPPRDASCLECHVNQQQTVEAGVHGKGNAGCTDCHGGNPQPRPGRELEKVRKAKAHDTSKAFTKIPVEACAKCHEEVVAALEAGPHGPPRKDKGSPACWECHARDLNAPKAHEMVPPTLALFADTCARCHKNKPALTALGADFRAMLEPAERAVAAWDAGEGGGRNPLADELAQVLRLQHGLDRGEIRTRARSLVGRTPVERPYALVWLGLMWAVIAALLVMTTLKLRQVRREET